MADIALIIGNGFDIDMGLPTRYSDFIRSKEWNEAVKRVWGFPCGHCLPCRSSEKEGVKIPQIGKFLYGMTHLFENRYMRISSQCKKKIKKRWMLGSVKMFLYLCI